MRSSPPPRGCIIYESSSTVCDGEEVVGRGAMRDRNGEQQSAGAATAARPVDAIPTISSAGVVKADSSDVGGSGGAIETLSCYAMGMIPTQIQPP